MFQPLDRTAMIQRILKPHYPLTTHTLPEDVLDALSQITALDNPAITVPEKLYWGLYRLAKEDPGFDFSHLDNYSVLMSRMAELKLDKDNDLGVSREAVLLTGYPLVLDLYTKHPKQASLDNLLTVARFSLLVEEFYFNRTMSREEYLAATAPLFAKMAKLELMMNATKADEPTPFEMLRMSTNDGKTKGRFIRTEGGTFEC